MFRERKNKLVNDLKEVQDKLMANQHTHSNIELELRIREDLNEVLKQEEIMWAQKAKVKWLQLGDQNTKYFQKVATIRKKRNALEKIKDSNGYWWFKGEGLEQVFVQEFRLRFSCGSAHSLDKLEALTASLQPCIEHRHNSQLQPITEDEVWDAVKSTGPFKAPGPDGIGAAFYQDC